MIWLAIDILLLTLLIRATLIIIKVEKEVKLKTISLVQAKAVLQEVIGKPIMVQTNVNQRSNSYLN